MSRPVNADAEATRARILGAARRLFAEQGRGSTTVRQIATDACVSLGTIHHYYGSKDDLYEACIGAMYDELDTMRDELLATFTAGGSPAKLVEQAARGAFCFARSHRGALRLLLREVVGQGDLGSQRQQRYLLPYLDRASQLLSSVLGRSALDVRLVLQSMVHLVVRYALTSNAELTLVANHPDEGVSVALVEDHLVHVAQVLLLGDRPPA